MPLRLGDLRHAPTVFSYLAGAERVLGAPVYFLVETVNRCNLRCVYCPQSRPEEHFPNGRGRMTLAQFDVVLERLVEAFRPRFLSLHRDGEPLLHADLPEFVRRATARGMRVSFSSNATLLTRARAEALVAAGLTMINTDFCADPATYESLRAGAHWERTRDGLRHILDAAETAGSPFRLVIKDLAATADDPAENRRRIEATRALFADHAARITVVPVHFHNALGHSARDLSAPSNPGKAPRYGLCHQPWISLTVDWAGRVVACCRDLRSEVVLGNLLEQPARTIWNGPEARRLRRALAARNPGAIATCATCDLPWNGSYSGRGRIDRIKSFLFTRTHGQA